jgi:hypothetical protein
MPCDAHGREDAHGKPHTWVWHYPDRETYSAWLELPLIVLAGLR